jgi:TRAP-type C4-dicarboxylate transport system substrate-binding protein
MVGSHGEAKNGTVKSWLRAIVALSLLALLTGCQTSVEADPSKAGGPGTPVLLRIGTDEVPGYVGAGQIERFASEVDELSEGSMRIEPVWDAAGHASDWDQVVARKVVAGELEMGLIPTRAWDTEGVTSLRVLNAPFLITSDALVATIVTSDLVDVMLAGVEDIGLVGLGLFPDELRHPFGFHTPLLGPESYDAATLRAPTSATTKAMFEALGAVVTDDEIDADSQSGMESSYSQRVTGTSTGNVVFYPKVNSLVINDAAHDELSDEQQAILEEATTNTRDWAIANLPADSVGASEHCDAGQSVVLVSADQMAALEEATKPVYAQLEQDPLTRSLIESVRTMAVTVPASSSTPPECRGAVAGASDDQSTASDQDASAVNGIYRVELTEEALRARGVIEEDIRNLSGVWTIRLEDGVLHQEVAGAPLLTGDIPYTVLGDLFTIHFEPIDGGDETYRWALSPTGDLDLTIVEVSQPALAFVQEWTAEPWTRIGEVDSQG